METKKNPGGMRSHAAWLAKLAGAAGDYWTYSGSPGADSRSSAAAIAAPAEYRTEAS